MVNVDAASVQTLAEQGPDEAPPLHLPSVPIYPSQVVESPVYDEQVDNVAIHPLPVVLHPV